jgi:hypothetical protein
MKRKILFLGTSHVGSFRRVAKESYDPYFDCDFAAFGVPIWRLMLNQSDLVVRSDSLVFDIYDSGSLANVIKYADARFDLVCQRVKSIIDDPNIVSNLSQYSGIVFVDCLFRYPPGLSFSVGNDDGYLLHLCDQILSLDLLCELPNVAGAITSFTEPFLSKYLSFRIDRRTSFIDLFVTLHDALAGAAPLFLWTFPGFSKQFPSGFVDTSVDRDLMAHVHRHALRRNNISLNYLQPPPELLDPTSGRVLPQYMGQGFHANDAFATLSLQSILQAVRGLVS